MSVVVVLIGVGCLGGSLTCWFLGVLLSPCPRPGVGTGDLDLSFLGAGELALSSLVVWLVGVESVMVSSGVLVFWRCVVGVVVSCVVVVGCVGFVLWFWCC